MNKNPTRSVNLDTQTVEAAASAEEIKILIAQIQSVLTPNLLTKKYAQLNRKSATEGHCYAASEALYHMLGGKTAGYVPCVASFTQNGENMTHWWIRNQKGDIFDPTAEQFTSLGLNPPYQLGKGAGFLTKLPSKRAQKIIERVLDLEIANRPEAQIFKPKI